jgi:thymidylate kinase
MNRNLYIFEGYDGSGKGTLISELAQFLRSTNKTYRIVGRKDEEALKPISLVIEDPGRGLSHRTEMLLRIALEVERLRLITQYQGQHDCLILDRGPLSLQAWIRNYDLDPAPFLALLEYVDEALAGSVIFYCDCDFERCWTRIGEKATKSWKESLGKAANAEWHKKYHSVRESFSKKNYRIIDVDTTLPLSKSRERVISNVATQA